MNPEVNHRMKLIVIAFIGVVLLGTYIILTTGQKKNLPGVTDTAVSPTQSMNNKPTPTPVFTKAVNKKAGSISIEADTISKTAQTVQINLIGNSGGKDITGYDIMIEHDSTVDLTDFHVDSSDFQVFSFPHDTYTSVTAVKKPGINTSSIFKDTSILRFTAARKSTAPIKIRIVPAEGKETTKFVDINNQIYTPETGDAYIASP